MPLSQYQMAQPGISQLGNLGSQIALRMSQQQAQQAILQRQLAMQQAEMQSKMALQRQQEALYGAQARESEAQAGYHGARTGQIQSEQTAADALGQALRGMQQYSVGPTGREEGPFEQTARNANAEQQFLNMIQQAGALAGRGNQYAMPAAAQGTQMRNPIMQAILAAGGVKNLYQNVGPNSVGYSPSGLPTVIGPQSQVQGSVGFAPQVDVSGGMGATNQVPSRSGLPSKTPAGLDLQKLLGSNQALLGNIMPLGVAPRETAPTYPIFNTTTNQIAQIQALLGQALAGQTNAPGLDLPPVQRETELDTTMPTIQTKQDFDALPKGAKYIGKDGKTYMKP